MNIDLIRFTDKYLGTLLRLALYYYQKIRDLFPQKQNREPFKRILVVKFWGIGNIIRASPTFKAIRKRFPGARITFITLSRNLGIYEGSDLFDEVIYLKLRSVRAFLWDIIRMFFVLRRKKFDLVLDMEPLANFSEIVSFYVGVGARVGFTVPGRRSLFTIKVPFREDEHISRTFFRILSPFGLEIAEDLNPLPVPVSSEDKRYVRDLFESFEIGEDDITIALNVNASEVADARRWPPQNYARLARQLITELGAKLIFIGAPDESERVQEVIDMTGLPGLNIAGKTDLKQAAAALERTDIFVTNDSGPMHLAMTMGTPTVALFGPETPLRYGPISDSHIAIYKNYDCSPCIKFSQAKKIRCTEDSKCIMDITVEEVFAGVLTLFQKLRKNRE